MICHELDTKTLISLIQKMGYRIESISEQEGVAHFRAPKEPTARQKLQNLKFLEALMDPQETKACFLQACDALQQKKAITSGPAGGEERKEEEKTPASPSGHS